MPSLRAGIRYGRRNVKTTSEGSSDCSNPSTPKRVYFPHVPGSQEGWLTQTYHRSRTANQVHQVGAFQDGRNPSSKKPATAGRNWT